MQYDDGMSHDVYVAFIQEQWREEDEERAVRYRATAEAFGAGTSLFVDRQCVILRRPKIAENLLSGLDEDHLAPLVPSREILSTGYQRQGEHLLIPHPVLRRSFHCKNTINKDLIAALLALGERHGVQPRLRFDLDAIGIADSLQMYEERDYWRGPKVGKDLRELPTDVIVHKYVEDTPQRRLTGIDRVEFHLTAPDDSGVRSIRMEEVHSTATGPRWERGEEPSEFVERFIHGDLAPDGLVSHLDGAYRGYSQEEWELRRKTDIKRHGRQGVYEKLFKINAPLAQEEFGDLAVKFFWMNPLVPEMLQALLAEGEREAG